jgi:TIR domain
MSRNPEMESRRHEPKRVLSVFLCHSFEDTLIAREIYYRLSADGIAPWLDVENILAGQDWELEIRKAIEAFDVFIACLSERSINKVGVVQRKIKISRLLQECPVTDLINYWQLV